MHVILKLENNKQTNRLRHTHVSSSGSTYRLSHIIMILSIYRVSVPRNFHSRSSCQRGNSGRPWAHWSWLTMTSHVVQRLLNALPSIRWTFRHACHPYRSVPSPGPSSAWRLNVYTILGEKSANISSLYAEICYDSPDVHTLWPETINTVIIALIFFLSDEFIIRRPETERRSYHCIFPVRLWTN